MNKISKNLIDLAISRCACQPAIYWLRESEYTWDDLITQSHGWAVWARGCLADQPDAVAELESRGIGVDARDGSGWTPLHRAAMDGHDDCVQTLIDAGADVNARNKGGWTPLRCAVRWSYAECATMLRAAGGKK